ncbi:MAG TPA: trimethylamine methyltransferase [Gammaproteobacteria bacterium]|nr:trimethylamine methyltransferase [Gammaproteobacteria bacterium]HBK75555.1 trimethylamine methyltransferase [Gammaproteobacteria bacterium]HIM88829.1 trimethylamine methyltransferase [Gammaproteobacteria bacterium]HIM96549.1 trimethylamine methyltransferase [Gammaproteobacteria bacterium]HIO34377.1 trimethylamine methyltransferase [Gammaproteobacteria bacterium]
MTLQPEKHTRKGGRSARRAARVNAPIIHQPALVPNIPVYEVVNAEGVEQIHDLAMRIVENIGVDFRDAESLEIWKKTDAEIQGERVRVSRDTLMALVDQAPSEYVHHARNPQRTVTVGGRSMVVSPSYGPPYIYDLEGKRRPATLEDLHNLQKLNHMASSVHIAGGPVVEPMDIPVPHRHLHMAYSGFKYSDKPIVGNVTTRERAEDTIDLCKIVFGDDFATNNCCTTSLINANSPLVWDATMLDALKVYAANNHAVMCSPFSMAAASTPASNVGTMAVVTAEALMAIAFAQLVRPGSPMLFGVPAMTVALNTGAPVHGSPDSAIVQFLAGQMARRYGIPHRAIANCATSKSADMQAAYDSMWGLFPSFLAGAQWITMAGGMMEGTLGVGYAKTVIDFEQLDAFYHFCQGCRFDDLDEIFETVKDVGPGGHFLGAAHTRKANLFIFPSQNNVTYEQWDDEGRKDSEQVGLDKAKQWLARYEEPEFDPTIDEALSTFITEKEATIPSELR